MYNLKDIRVVQKKKKCSELKEVDGKMVVCRWVENLSYTIQVKRDGLFAEWEDVPVIEEWVDA